MVGAMVASKGVQSAVTMVSNSAAAMVVRKAVAWAAARVVGMVERMVCALAALSAASKADC